MPDTGALQLIPERAEMPSAKGRTLLDRELYLPRVWADDRERRREAGVPESVGFQTKPQQAGLMQERVLESGVPFAWFTGDEVYGSDRNLRRWDGLYRHITLAMLAHAYLAVIRNQASEQGERGGTTAPVRS